MCSPNSTHTRASLSSECPQQLRSLLAFELLRLAAPLSGPRKNQGSGWAGRAPGAKCPPALSWVFRGLRCTTGRARGTGGWRATAGRALGEEIASPLVLEPDLSCHDMWAGLGEGETTRGRRLVLNTQGCPGNASPKPKSGRSDQSPWLCVASYVQSHPTSSCGGLPDVLTAGYRHFPR